RSPAPVRLPRAPILRRPGSTRLSGAAVRLSPVAARLSAEVLRSGTTLLSAVPSLLSSAINVLSLGSCASPLIPLFRGNLVRAGVIDERIVGDRLDRREVLVGDPFRPGRRADVI